MLTARAPWTALLISACVLAVPGCDSPAADPAESPPAAKAVDAAPSGAEAESPEVEAPDSKDVLEEPPGARFPDAKAPGSKAAFDKAPEKRAREVGPVEPGEVQEVKLPPLEGKLQRPIPGTGWARELELMGRVRKVTLVVEGEGGREAKAVKEFSQHGQLANVWYEGKLGEEATLNGAGDVTKRVTKAEPGDLITSLVTENLAFDAAHRVVSRVQSTTLSTSPEPKKMETKFTYDARGRVLTRTDTHLRTDGSEPRVEVETFTYDDDGDWATRTTSTSKKERIVTLASATTKTLTVRHGPSAVQFQTYDRRTGWVSEDVIMQGYKLVHTYEGVDKQGNWTVHTVRREGKTPGLVSKVTRVIEYFE